MLTLPSVYSRPLQHHLEVTSLPTVAGVQSSASFPGLQPSLAIPGCGTGTLNPGFKQQLKFPASYQSSIFNVHGDIIVNNNILLNCYNNGATPVSAYHPKTNSFVAGTNPKTTATQAFISQQGTACFSQPHFQPFQTPVFHGTLPPFSMFGNLLSKGRSSVSLQGRKVGYESVAQKGLPSTAQSHSQDANSPSQPSMSSKCASETSANILSGNAEQKTLKRCRMSASETAQDQAHEHTSRLNPKHKRLRHSIASILNIVPGPHKVDENNDDLSNNGVDNHMNTYGETESLSDVAKRRTLTPDLEIDDEVQDEVDVTSCSVNSLIGLDMEKTCMFGSGIYSNGGNTDEGTNTRKTHSDSSGRPVENHSLCPEVETDRHCEANNTDISLPNYRNEHLEKLEKFITNEDNSRFKRDDFFLSQLQIFGFDSQNSSSNCSDDAGKVRIQKDLLKGDVKNVLTDISSVPPTTSTFARSCASTECSSATLPPIQTLCHTYQSGETDERSAFKPIVKSLAPPPLLPELVVPYLDRTRGTNLAPSVETSMFKHSSRAGLTKDGLCPLGPGQEFQQITGQTIDESKSKMDAISMLRHRSSVYQRHGITETSLPPKASPSATEHLPSTLGIWLTWLRRRENNSANSAHLEQQTPPSCRVPPPPRYHCDACNKTYSTFGGLSKHRQFHCSHHVKKEFSCKVCSKAYSSLGALKMHIRTHTLPCKCHVCGKAFSRPWLLQGHVRTHTGEKPFRCSHCGRAFADRSNLRAHLQTHAEIKKYACKKCGKTFSRMSLLTKHSDGSCPGNLRCSTDIC